MEASQLSEVHCGQLGDGRGWDGRSLQLKNQG